MRSVAGYTIPAIVMFFLWVVVIVLVVILVGFVIHWAGGATLDLRLGHFTLDIGFS